MGLQVSCRLSRPRIDRVWGIFRLQEIEVDATCSLGRMAGLVSSDLIPFP